MKQYDIFISYRREGGYDTAKHLNDLLVRDGYKVSFDIDTLRCGDFDTQLLERIDQCMDFILIVDQHAFDRTLDPKFNPKNDWLRCELAYALKKNKNIIPVFLSGATGFPANLPNDVVGVTKKNGPEYSKYHFDAFYKDLKKRFLHSSTNISIKKGALFSLFFISIIVLALSLYNTKKYPKSNDSIELVNNNQIHNSDFKSSEECDVKNTISEDIISNSNKTTEQTKEQALELFCGTYSLTLSSHIIWFIELDPVNKNVSAQVEDVFKEIYENATNINNSLGYIGSDFKVPEYWNIVSFNLSNDYKSAIVELILNFSAREYSDSFSWEYVHCCLKLELDDYNNLKVSFVSGNVKPWILTEYDYSDDVPLFIRQ